MVVIFAMDTCSVGWSQQPYKTISDVEFAKVDGRDLLLDLHLPKDVEAPLLMVWVHGGAWRSGKKENVPLGFVKSGIATASVGYRLSGEAMFPALIFDIKAAIRFLRANANKYGYQADKIAIAGNSAGGHLAALVGVTNGHKELEGALGEYLEESSSVQAIIDYYGPTNFNTILKQSTPHGLSVRVPALELLIGDRPENVVPLATLASPIAHVNQSVSRTLWRLQGSWDRCSPRRPAWLFSWWKRIL